MNAKINQLVQTVLQKESLAVCSITELQDLAKQYPYSSAMQLLYTAKLKTADSNDYRDQLQKTLLFFDNPLWLQLVLEESNETDTLNENQNLPEKEVQEEPQNAGQSPVLDLSSLKFEKKEPTGNELLFEPYHTVDYFASQGVKYKADEKPNDKFGQQLKSFTEWLKILKKSPSAEINTNNDSTQEQKVEQLAADSIENRNVVTEAMAEVWEKQGNASKAIEIYNKLGLLNPSKSSYFAAKIEHLKNLI